jgi:hypothetical protein
MKIVLQNTETLAFYGKAQSWTPDLEDAVGFADAVDALDYASHNGVTYARVVMAFGDRQFELHTPAMAEAAHGP